MSVSGEKDALSNKNSEHTLFKSGFSSGKESHKVSKDVFFATNPFIPISSTVNKVGLLKGLPSW